WRAAVGPIRVRGTGTAAVAAAQHNCHVLLTQPPSARNLRQLLIAQLNLSTAAAVLARPTDAQIADGFERRADCYRHLVAAARDVDGLAGAPPAAVHAAIQAASLAQKTPSLPNATPASVRALAHASRGVDTRVRAVIDRGLSEGVYAVPTGTMAMRTDRGGIHREVPLWRPIEATDAVRLRDLARQLLPGNAPATHAPQPLAVVTREVYRDILTRHGHRPSLPGLSA
ncbi:MAG: hypothetical protein ACRDPG_04540, partial [Nocardioidaceae bacterium]